MKLNKNIIAAVAAVSLLATAGIASSYNKSESCKSKRNGPVNCMTKELNLTEAQQSEVSELFQEMRTNSKALRESFKEQKPLAEATKNGKFDKNVFLSTLQTHQEAKNRLKADYMEHLYNALTKEQKAAFVAQAQEGSLDKCMKKRHKKHHKKHDNSED